MIGQTVGGYVILDRIGAGGMGEVYLGEHRRLEKRAAIKFLLPGLSKDAGLVSRFFNEARALSRIQHPGIVEVFDCDVLEDRAFIVMEYLDGESMAAVLDRIGGFAGEANAVAAVIGQIASALAAAHDKGIIHRDLKPENVFFSLGRQLPFAVRILDFGIAKLAADNLGETAHTRPGSLLGTPSYMAPEQCRGVSGIDHRVDVYALGCILFELLTGRKVFEMEAPGDLIVAHIQTPPPRLAACVPGVSAALDELVARMLAKNPDDRPQSMAEVIATIEGLLGVPAASFPQAISATSLLVPVSPSGAVPPTRVMPIVKDEVSGVSTGVPLKQATPAPRSGGVAGSTQVLPDALALPRGRVAQPSQNDSTFSRTAAEILPKPPGRVRPVAIVAGLGAAALAVTLAVTLRSEPKRALPDEAPRPFATSPTTSPASPPGGQVVPPDPAPAAAPPAEAPAPAAQAAVVPPAPRPARDARAEGTKLSPGTDERASSHRSNGHRGDKPADSSAEVKLEERLTRKDVRKKDRHKATEPSTVQPATAADKTPSKGGKYFLLGD